MTDAAPETRRRGGNPRLLQPRVSLAPALGRQPRPGLRRALPGLHPALSRSPLTPPLAPPLAPGPAPLPSPAGFQRPQPQTWGPEPGRTQAREPRTGPHLNSGSLPKRPAPSPHGGRSEQPRTETLHLPHAGRRTVTTRGRLRSQPALRSALEPLDPAEFKPSRRRSRPTIGSCFRHSRDPALVPPLATGAPARALGLSSYGLRPGRGKPLGRPRAGLGIRMRTLCLPFLPLRYSLKAGVGRRRDRGER